VLPSGDTCTIKKKEHHQLLTVTLWSAVHALGVLFVLILEFSEISMARFLVDMNIVEVLNESVGDSSS
jgi:hypothetical protein